MKTRTKEKGFSIVEMVIAMSVVLILLGVVSTIMFRSLSIRARESSKTDALSSTQAALNVISREVANSGYGLDDNGIIAADSGAQKIRIRANLINTNNCVTDLDEDVSYFYDQITKSIVRSERHYEDPSGAGGECGASNKVQTSVVVNRVSDIQFQYFDYTPQNTAGVLTTAPTENTGRVVVTVTVKLEDVAGQPSNQEVKLQSDITLRNSKYMRNQY